MRLGRHMPTNSKMVRATEIAASIGCEAIQIFASNPTGWRPPAEDPATCAAFAESAKALNLYPVVLHAPYLINLGSPDPANWSRSIALLTWTLHRGALLGARFVVFHTGSHGGAGIEAGITRVIEGITRVLSESPAEVMLLLENDVGAGNSLGSSFELLHEILQALPQFYDRLGVCLDTAHLWGAGYDLSTATSALAVLQNFAETVGTERLRIIHLNDTEKALGSHRDVHARLGEGIIGKDGLHAFFLDPRLDHVAVLMETPIKTDEHDKEDWQHDATQIAKAKALLERTI